MNTSQFDFFLTRYKGGFVRLYLSGEAHCQGLLVGAWRDCFVMMVNSSKGLLFRYVKFAQIQYIYPYQSLASARTSYIPQLVYSNRN